MGPICEKAPCLWLHDAHVLRYHDDHLHQYRLHQLFWRGWKSNCCMDRAPRRWYLVPGSLWLDPNVQIWFGLFLGSMELCRHDLHLVLRCHSCFTKCHRTCTSYQQDFHDHHRVLGPYQDILLPENIYCFKSHCDYVDECYLWFENLYVFLLHLDRNVCVTSWNPRYWKPLRSWNIPG